MEKNARTNSKIIFESILKKILKQENVKKSFIRILKKFWEIFAIFLRKILSEI